MPDPVETARISSGLDRVWAAVVDYESRPNWSSRVKEARRLDDGPLKIGSRVRLRVGRNRFTATVVELRERQWLAVMVKGPGFRVTHSYSLGPDGDDTLLTLTAAYGGAVGRLAARLFRRSVVRDLVDEIEAIKAAAEASPKASP